MAFRDHELGQLVRTDPARAAAIISERLEQNDGAIRPTAENVDIDAATLRRWIGRLKDGGHEVGPVRGRGNPDITEAQERGRETIRKRVADRHKKRASKRSRKKVLAKRA